MRDRKPGTGGKAATGGTIATGVKPETGGKAATGGSFAVSCSTEVEPNETFAQAMALSTRVCGSISKAGDADWYKATMTSATKTLTLTADKDATFSLGYVIAGSCTINTNGLRQVQVTASGSAAILCIVVKSATNATQSYSLSFAQ